MFNSGSDPFVNALKSFGYNIVRLPKADIQPLLLLSKNGDNLEWMVAQRKHREGGIRFLQQGFAHREVQGVDPAAPYRRHPQHHDHFGVVRQQVVEELPAFTRKGRRLEAGDKDSGLFHFA